MPDIPEEAVQAATAAITNLSCEHEGFCFECEARAALAAATPVLAAHAARHAAVRLRHGNRNPQNIYQVLPSGSEVFVAVVMDPDRAAWFVDLVNRASSEEEIRADERRKVAAELRDVAYVREHRRRFYDRHLDTLQGATFEPKLLEAVADEIEALPERRTDG